MAERGITLVALVITIIVLLILAGVSISLTIGQNGILTQATNAVNKNREAQEVEEIALAWASCETDYWSAWTKDSSVTKADFFEGENGIKKYLKGTGEVTSFSYNEGEISEITYKSNSSADANPGQYIISANGKVEKKTGVILNPTSLSLEPGETATITATLKEIEGTVTWASETPGVATVSDGVVTAVANGTANITATCGGKSATCKVTVVGKLSSVVNVGDYVNINVGYTDKMVASTTYTTTGWRVLSKNTTTGVVRLISTGHPLKFYHPYDADDNTSGETSVTMLKEIEGGSITLQSSGNNRGYQESGFTPQNMSGIFGNTSIFSGVTLPVRADFSSIGADNDLRKTGKSYWLGEYNGSYVCIVDTNSSFGNTHWRYSCGSPSSFSSIWSHS